jgi:hypothetical protein
MTEKFHLDDFSESLWMAGHLRGAARELRELLDFLSDERNALASANDSFSRGGVAALSLALIHIRQRAAGLETSGRGFDAALDKVGVELPEVQLIEVTRLTPDTDVQCNECGGMPTVTATLSDGTTRNTHQCGPCFFGNASYRDPATWPTSAAR